MISCPCWISCTGRQRESAMPLCSKALDSVETPVYLHKWQCELNPTGCLDYVVYLWVQCVCQILFTWIFDLKAHGPSPVKKRKSFEGDAWKSTVFKIQDLEHSAILSECTHPRCWQWRSPAHGQCFLGPSSGTSQDNRSIRWLEVPKQRSRSMGLARQTGKSRAEHAENTQMHFLR